MSNQYRLLRNDRRKQHLTIADALDVLVTDAGFGAGDVATIATQGLNLPDGRVAWLVALLFDRGLRSDAEAAVVFLRTASTFSVMQAGNAKRRCYPIELLEGGTVDHSGAVLTVNGDRFRAVEVKPARLPYEATPLEQKIIAATLSTKAWAERDIYRDISQDWPPEARPEFPIEVLDYSKLVKAAQSGRPMLKHIQRAFAERFSHRPLPTVQKISRTLKRAGL